MVALERPRQPRRGDARLSGRRRTGAFTAGVLISAALPCGASRAAAGVTLVVPFENKTGSPAASWIGEALADGLVSAISASGADVIGREDRREVERELGIGPLAVTTIATRLKEGEELEADRVILGQFTGGADSLRVSARLYTLSPVSRGSEITLPAMPAGDIAAIQALLAQRVLAPGEQPPAGFKPPAAETRAEAYEARMRGLTEEDPARRAGLLERAVEIAPDYLRARIELADAYGDAGSNEKALLSLSRAPLTGPAPLVAEAEALQGALALESGLLTPAIDAFRRSLRQQEDADIRLLLARTLIRRGDLAIASAEIELAARSDPENPELPEVRRLLEAAHARPAGGTSGGE